MWCKPGHVSPIFLGDRSPRSPLNLELLRAAREGDKGRAVYARNSCSRCIYIENASKKLTGCSCANPASLSCIPTLSLSHTHSLSHTYTRTHALSLSLSRSSSLALWRAEPRAPPRGSRGGQGPCGLCPLSLSLSLTHTHTQTHTLGARGGQGPCGQRPHALVVRIQGLHWRGMALEAHGPSLPLSVRQEKGSRGMIMNP